MTQTHIPKCMAMISVDMVIDAIRSYSAARQKTGIVIGTYAAVPYIHLQLESRKRFAPETECLVIDDGSSDSARLSSLCSEYGADFICRPKRMGHVPGDMQTFVQGHEWARELGLKLLIKLSRRWLPIAPWVEETERIWNETGAPTLNSSCHFHRFGFRSECVAMDVDAWKNSDATKSLRDHVSACASHPPDLDCGRSGVLVEHVVHIGAAAARGARGDGSSNYAAWPWMGDNRTNPMPGRLWHESNNTQEYVDLARSWGITQYAFSDFVQPAGNIHLRGPAEPPPAPPARQSCCGGGKTATVTEKVVNAVGAAVRVVSALVMGEDVLVPAETVQARMDVCLGCEHLWAPTVLQCKVCGCWVRAKTKLATDKCPEGK